MLYACPKCGKPDSCWGDNFCGECEQEYWSAQEEYVKILYDNFLEKCDEDTYLSFADFRREVGM